MTTANVLLAWKMLCRAYETPRAFFVTLMTTLSFLFFLLLIPNYSLLASAFVSPLFTPMEKIGILFGIFETMPTFFTPLGQVITIATALLIGTITNLLAFSMRNRVLRRRMAGNSAIGIISSMIGIGCASCGSIILSSLIGLSATVGFLSFLPLGGDFFGVIGLLILLFTRARILLKRSAAATCR